MDVKEEILLLSDYLTARQILVYLKLSEDEQLSFLAQYLTSTQIAEYKALKEVIEIKSRILERWP